MIPTHNQIDVAIIGAGPAGLAAALGAKEAGAENVTIIERSEEPGGLLFQCIHNGFGLQEFNEDLTGPEYAHRLIDAVTELKVNMKLSTMVLNIASNREMLLSSSKNALHRLKPKSVVLAMGCRERTAQSILITGTRPAGVLTAGTAQRYVNVKGLMPGKTFIVLGSGDIGMIMARRLTLEGAEVKAVVEKLPYIGGLIRNEVQCLYDFDIPVLLEHTVLNVHGIERVEAVTLAKLDPAWQPIPGTERTIECDTLLISAGLIPENELSLKAGIALDPLVGGPIVDERMETNIPGFFAGGNVVHVHDSVDNVSGEARKAGMYAAEYAMGKTKPSERKVHLKAGANIRYVVPNSISGEQEVTLYMRVVEPADKVELRIGDIYKESLRAVRPSEMLKVRLSSLELDRLDRGTGEVIISCQRKER